MKSRANDHTQTDREPPPSNHTDPRVERELPIFAAGRASRTSRQAALQERRPAFALELRTVMLVDDAPEMARIVSRMFAALDVEVVGTTSPSTAVDLARSATPQLALVDIYLEHGNARSGLDLIVALRAQSPDLVIGAISGAMTAELASDCKGAGATWVLGKPFSRSKLFEAMLVGRLPMPAMLRVDQPLETMKQLYVSRVVEAQGGSKSAAARVLGKRRTTLQRMVNRKR